MALAVRFRENLHGTWYRLEAPDEELPAAFEIDSELAVVRIATTGRAAFSGRLRLDGHATDVIVRGDMRFDGRTKTVGYVFDYVADDGARHRFVGQKDILPIHFPEGVLELSATLYKGGAGSALGAAENEVGRVRLRTSSTRPILTTLRTIRVGFGRDGTSA